MRIKVNNLKKGIPRGDTDTFEALSVSKDPEGRYAVVKIQFRGIYFAIKIISEDDDMLIGEYVGHYVSYSDDPMLMRYQMDWGCIYFGFAKIVLWAPEMANKWNGSFEKTVKRFYFDWELYKKSYEKQHGVPCPKRDPNQ